MEDHRIIKTITNILGGTLFVLPLFVFGYDDHSTHPALTQEIVKFFNLSYREQKISEDEMELIIKGSIDEDLGFRWMNHFFDPVYQRGLVLENDAFPKNPELAVIASHAKSPWLSAKTWAQSSTAQSGILNSLTASAFGGRYDNKDDYSWERAIYEYAWGDKKHALLSLGHTLHLLEDTSVPDHTRNDPHPAALHDGSPFETWAKKFNRNNIDIDLGGQSPVLLKDLSSHFDSIANYSNNNFFSKDTINSGRYSMPKITQNGPGFFYAIDNKGNQFKLVKIVKKFGSREIQYTLEDDNKEILSDYWSLLSKQAVLHGAGVIKLFFDEVEKERQTKVLYEKNRSWLSKRIDSFKNGAFAAASIFYGSSVTQSDLTDELEIEKPAAPPTPVQTIKEPPKETNIIVGASEPKPPLALAAATAPLPLPVQTPPQEPPQAPKPTTTTSPSLPIAGVGAPPPPPAVETAPVVTEAPVTADTSGPDNSFTISQCGDSLSPDACLLASSTLNLSWSSSAPDLDHYEITCTAGGSACSNFTFSPTTATSTTYVLPTDSTSYEFSARGVDTSGNAGTSTSQTVELKNRPLVVNEIAWAGTSAAQDQDEWIEIKNTTDHELTLSNFVLRSATDNSPYIQLAGTLAGQGYLLLERTDDTTISNISAGQVYTGSLANSGEKLEISLASTTIDQTPEVSLCSGWCGGSASGQYYTMERYDSAASGENSSNWGSWAGFLGNGSNADNAAINGTPGQRNSISYLIDKSGSLTQSKTLATTSSPYIISSMFTVQAGATLSIDPGVVIKFLNSDSSLLVNGAVRAVGTSANKVIFTSFKDDSHAGDTNQDASASSPQKGDWSSIKILAAGSTIDHTLIRYGGEKDMPFANHWANVRAENVSLDIKNSIIEYSEGYGIRFKNVSGTVENNVVQNNNTTGTSESSGIFATDGSLTIQNNTIQQNGVGVFLNTDGGTHAFTVANNTFTGNTAEAIMSVNVYPSFSGNTATGNGINGIEFQGTISQSYTFTGSLPYVISNTLSVAAEKILTILEGVIVKLKSSGAIAVSGQVFANGSAANRVIFTSIKDDTAGGDTNNDGGASSPAAGDWPDISFGLGSSSSTLQYTTVRYGGTTNPISTTMGALRVMDASIDIINSIFESNYRIGVLLKNSTSTSITNSTVRNHREPSTISSYGLDLQNSSPFIQSTTFQNNKTAIHADGGSSVENGGGNVFEGNTTDTDPVELIP